MSSDENLALKANCKVKQILEMPLASGDIYWLKQKSQGHVHLARPGDFLNLEFFKKFNDTHQFHVKRVINFENYLDLKNKLTAFKNTTTERSRVEALVNYLFLVKSNYFVEGAESSILSFCCANFDNFKFEGADFYRSLYDLSVPLFKRALKLGALGSTFAMATGYTDLNMIRDFYNICFYSVYGFLNENYLTQTLKRLEDYRIDEISIEELKPGGIEKLKNDIEKQFELNFKSDFIKSFNTYSFEKLNGKGSPQKLSEDEVSDLEGIIIFLSNALTFEDIEFKPLDGKNYLSSLLKSDNAVMGDYRLKKLLINRFENLQQIEKSYAEMMA